MTFKVGDKIRRVGKCYPEYEKRMVKGNIYTIKEFYGDSSSCVELCEGGTGRGWLLANFIKVEDDFPELLKKAKEIRRLGNEILIGK